MEVTTIGIDLPKNVFAVCGADSMNLQNSVTNLPLRAAKGVPPLPRGPSL